MQGVLGAVGPYISRGPGLNFPAGQRVPDELVPPTSHPLLREGVEGAKGVCGGRAGREERGQAKGAAPAPTLSNAPCDVHTQSAAGVHALGLTIAASGARGASGETPQGEPPLGALLAHLGACGRHCAWETHVPSAEHGA